MEGRTFRHTYLAHDHALVFLRNETRRQYLHEQHEQHDRAAEQGERDPPVLQVFLYRALVLAEDGIVAGLISNFCIVVEPFPFLACECFLVGRAHEDGAEGRAEHECTDATQTYRTGEGHAELGEERTARSAHEGHGDEHRHEHECTRDHGY